MVVCLPGADNMTAGDQRRCQLKKGVYQYWYTSFFAQTCGLLIVPHSSSFIGTGLWKSDEIEHLSHAAADTVAVTFFEP